MDENGRFLRKLLLFSEKMISFATKLLTIQIYSIDDNKD